MSPRFLFLQCIVSLRTLVKIVPSQLTTEMAIPLPTCLLPLYYFCRSTDQIIFSEEKNYTIFLN